MNFSRRQLEAFGETLGDCVTRREGGRIIYGGGGSSAPSSQTVTQTSIPQYARPYVEELLGKARAVTDQAFNPYQQYLGERVAQFTPLQQQSYEAAGAMAPAGQISDATAAAQTAVQRAQGMGYEPTLFQNQFIAPKAYEAGTFAADRVSPTADLQKYQMGPAERVGTGAFTDPGVAGSYMSPYIQNVLDVEKREAARQSAIQQQATQAQQVGQGAFGGSRSAIVEAERQRNLGQQMGDIETRGMQAAFDRAAQLYGTDAARQMQAQMANQQAGLTTGAQNLQALLGVQQLGAGQNLQAQLANQQAAMQAKQMGEASRQFGAQQGMMGAQLGAQYGQAAQQATEASRQFGANLGLQALNAQMQGAGMLGTLGQQQYGQELGIANLQNLYGQQQQQQVQNVLNQQYQDFLNYQNYPYKQLGFMSDMLRGLPLTQQSQTMYGGQGSPVSQVAGAALAGYGLLGRKEGGSVDSGSRRGAGLADLLISKIA